MNTFDLEAISKTYKENQPFPHIMLDDFWNQDELSLAVSEVTSLPEYIWLKYQDPTANEMIVQKKKMGLNQIYMLEKRCPTLEKIMYYMTSPTLLNFLTKLTGISDLIPDPSNLGGGIHRTSKGGKLSIHADFNIHPQTKLHRRVNVLLYLNKDWQDRKSVV